MLYYKEISLRYGDNTLDIHGDAYNGSASDQMEFRTVDARRPKIITFRDTGRMNNGRAYSHILGTSKRHSIVISADEADYATAVPFLENWWNAERKYIARNNGTAWQTYIEVFVEGEEFPLAELEDLYELPEVKLDMFEVS